MSLARAFTTKRGKKQLDVAPPLQPSQRPPNPRFAHGAINRLHISSPTELLSTTNMLSYDAPDIYPKDASKRIVSSSTASTQSGNESDVSRMTSSTSLTSADTLSIGSRSPRTPAGDPLSSFNFGKRSMEIPYGDEAPGIPQRAPSHTKKNHEIISRKNSIARMSSPKSPITVRSTMHMFSPNLEETMVAEPHPFGTELAQVTEIAEEYGITKETLAVADKEEQELLSMGLLKFKAEDYISEIQGLFMSSFGEVKPTMGPVWI